MLRTLFRSAQRAGGRVSVAPETQHVRGANAVDGRVQDELDDVLARPIDQVLPRKVERPCRFVPSSPRTLHGQLGSMSDVGVIGAILLSASVG